MGSSVAAPRSISVVPLLRRCIHRVLDAGRGPLGEVGQCARVEANVGDHVAPVPQLGAATGRRTHRRSARSACPGSTRRRVAPAAARPGWPGRWSCRLVRGPSAQAPWGIAVAERSLSPGAFSASACHGPCCACAPSPSIEVSKDPIRRPGSAGRLPRVADPAGRSGCDHVAGVQRDHLREVGDERRGGEHEVAGRGLLHGFRVDDRPHGRARRPLIRRHEVRPEQASCSRTSCPAATAACGTGSRASTRRPAPRSRRSRSCCLRLTDVPGRGADDDRQLALPVDSIRHGKPPVPDSVALDFI